MRKHQSPSGSVILLAVVLLFVAGAVKAGGWNRGQCFSAPHLNSLLSAPGSRQPKKHCPLFAPDKSSRGFRQGTDSAGPEGLG